MSAASSVCVWFFFFLFSPVSDKATDELAPLVLLGSCVVTQGQPLSYLFEMYTCSPKALL